MKRLSLGVLFAALLIFCSPAGAEMGPHIVGGESADSGAWPWAAFVTDSADGGSACTGTVVAPNVVMTAAHCVTAEGTTTIQPVSGFQVSTGDVDRTASDIQTSGVSQIVIPSNFTTSTNAEGEVGATDHDIALLELTSPTTEPAISLANSGNDAGAYTSGSGEAMAGWGLEYAGEDSADLPDTLQVANTVMQSADYCSQQDAGTAPPFDPADQICTENGPDNDTSFCNGDSGGPLVDVVNGTVIQSGIVSYSTDCATDHPDYFISVAYYYSWIENEIQTWAPPVASTGTATSSSSSTATLNGSVTPGQAASSYTLQWGTSTGYGQDTGNGQVTAGSGSVAVSANLTGLESATTYHYRLVVTNSNGTSYGADQTFTTQAAANSPSPPAGATTTSTPSTTPSTGEQPTPPSGSGSGQAKTLPLLTAGTARSDTTVVVQGVLPNAFTNRTQYRTSCARVFTARMNCGVNFSAGPNDYYGNVIVFYEFGANSKLLWSDRYTLHWVNDRCYFHSGHRRRCVINTRRGAY